MGNLSEPAATLLVRLLAAFQAPWAPIRQHWQACPAITARRDGQVSCGIGGGSGAERQRHSRQMAELREAGLVDSSNELTPDGKRLARSWCWPFTMEELLEAISRLQAAMERGDVLRSGDSVYVPEQLLTGTAWGREFGLLQWMFAPLLADRVLVSRSDIYGWTFYGPSADVLLTDAAAEAIGPVAALRDDLVGVYVREAKRCRDAMHGDTEYYSEIGGPPIAIGLLESGRSSNDFNGVPPLFTDDAEDPGDG